MNTETRGIINSEVWEIKQVGSVFLVINTHANEHMMSGSTTPDFVKSFNTIDEATKYLKEIYLNSLN